MKVDFDNLRRGIAMDFNDLAAIPHTGNELRSLQDLRSGIAGLLACHDPEDDEINVVEMKLLEPKEISK